MRTNAKQELGRSKAAGRDLTFQGVVCHTLPLRNLPLFPRLRLFPFPRERSCLFMKSSEVRRTFIDFFSSRGHTFVPSSSTIPVGDQTLLFTIAGMTQFKAALTGEEKRPYKRATNAQKCIRIGDLDDVVKDGSHCTMFEMLGSWSFGDYYKKEAIAWAFELSTQKLKFDLNKLWVTVHTSDDEAHALWKGIGMPPERIVKLGDKDNFWAMGPTGPCGPCSELYLDQGEAVGKCTVKNFDCKAGPGCDCDRYLEFWNLVFMQFDRKEDGTLVELPMKSVDTGAGLERITALLQNKTSAFDIDTFLVLKKAILERAGFSDTLEKTGLEATLAKLDAKQKESLNVVCDHIRTLTFTLADGANFSAEGRGYVLRRVLRRAVRHAHRLAPNAPKNESFLAIIVPSVVEQFGEFYPEIITHKNRIMEAIRNEEARFIATLESGLAKFNVFSQEARTNGSNKLSGEHIFALHDTFGFPSDLTRVLAEEMGLGVDLEGYALAMRGQKEKSRAEAKFYKFDQDDSPWVNVAAPSASLNSTDELKFHGYALQEATGKKQANSELAHDVLEVLLAENQVRRVRQLKNKLFEIVIAHSPFYPEGGGQVADSGWLRFYPHASKFAGPQEFELLDVRKTTTAIVLLAKHAEFSADEASPLGAADLFELFDLTAQGKNTPATAILDLTHRMATSRNHTATHLLHKALQVVLGDNVRQAGSMVSPQSLRFDFSHSKAVAPEELERVEQLVNAEILRNTKIVTHSDVKLEEAKKRGAMAMFDEKYDDTVRMLEVPGFSLELCGGTHVPATGSIGLLKITSEGSVTSGVRRIEAVTGLGVLDSLNTFKAQLRHAADVAKCAEADVPERIRQLREEIKAFEKMQAALQSRVVNAQVEGLLKTARDIAPGIKVVATVAEVGSLSELEMLSDRVKEKNGGVVVMGAELDGKAIVLAAVHPSATKAHKNLAAGNIVKQLCEKVDGKGGGRPDFARGGGSAPQKLPQAFAEVDDLIKSLL